MYIISDLLSLDVGRPERILREGSARTLHRVHRPPFPAVRGCVSAAARVGSRPEKCNYLYRFLTLFTGNMTNCSTYIAAETEYNHMEAIQPYLPLNMKVQYMNLFLFLSLSLARS
jgi:hypothetical protein